MKTSIFQNGLHFILDIENHTAKILSSTNSCMNIFIPRSITFESQEYLINCIKDYAFKEAETIIFDENSEITTVGLEFASSNVRSISFPKSIIKFNEGWCDKMKRLNHISISSKNKNLLYLDEKVIIGKSDPNSENYDTIIFARRDISELVIPSFIKHIDPYAFSYCLNLQSIIFLENSELISIGKSSFSNSGLQKIFIPKNVEIIGNESFLKCTKLSEIDFSKESELKQIGESAFAYCNQIKKIKIPSHVEKLNNFTFYECEHLETIEFDTNSEMNFFGCDLFNSSKIAQITIPSHIEVLNKQTFNECYYLNKISFEKNSELKKLCELFFIEVPLLEFEFPSKLETLENDWCGLAFDLTNVKISADNQNYKYFDDKTKIIMSKSNKDDDLFDVIEFACRDVTDFKIPSYVKEIKSSAFADCKKMKSVDLSECTQIKSLPKQAFNSSGITNIEIPDFIQLIEYGAFTFGKLISAEILGDKLILEEDLFRECNYLIVVSFPNANEIKIFHTTFYDVSLSVFILPNAKVIYQDS